MSQYNPKSESALAVARHSWDPPIRVKAMAFWEFSRSVDEGLADLVRRWTSRSAPCSRRTGRRDVF